MLRNKLLNNKRGEVGKYLLMYLLYIGSTILIFFAIALLISSIFQSNIDTNYFENRLYNERMAKLIGSEEPFDFENFQKQIAFKVTKNDKEFIYNEEFYKHAKPLAPVRYDLFIQNYPKIEQVYSNRVRE